MGNVNTKTIRAVIKAYNEEANIVECIKSLSDFANEVIIVDDQSTDNTAKLAEDNGARVVTGKSKNGLVNTLDVQGYLECPDGWITRLDADERMTPGLAKKLIEIANEDKYAGVRFARRNIMFGKWVKHGSWFKSDQLRFFKADSWDRSWSCHPHTQAAVSGQVLTLPEKEDLATIHYDYDSIAQFAERTLFKYARAEALKHKEAGKNFSLARLVFKPIKRTIGKYLIRQGFRDGKRGLMLAVMLGMYDFLIEANLWDLTRNETYTQK